MASSFYSFDKERNEIYKMERFRVKVTLGKAALLKREKSMKIKLKQVGHETETLRRSSFKDQ